MADDESNASRAISAKDPARASMYATLALADAIIALDEHVIAELRLLREQLQLLRGEPIRR